MSRNIIEIIRESVALVVVNTITPSFATMEMYEVNEKIDYNITFPVVILDRPLYEDSKVLPQGNVRTNHHVLLYIFSGRVELNDPMTIKEPLLTTAKEMKRQLIIELQNDNRIESISGYSSEELPESKELNINPCGLWLKLVITVVDNLAVC